MPLTLPAEGGCQCGQARYRITGEPLWTGVCHCNECKRSSGAAFSMSTRVRATDVILTKGALKTWSRPSDVRGAVICHFCPECGNRLWHEPEGSGFLHVKPGTLDDPSQVDPTFEGYTIRKSPWLSLSGMKMSSETQPPKREDR
jgi:hypothetical protein